jgi:hypothetical protein
MQPRLPARSLLLLLFPIALLSLGACADLAEPDGPADDGATSALEGAEAALDVDAASGRYYTVRHDPRRCIYPLCGGYWVSEVNRRLTRCPDGTRADECYVSDADLTALGLSEAQRLEVLEEAAAGRAVLRGQMLLRSWTDFGDIGVLHVDGAWRAATDRRPVGAYQRVEQLPILCLVEPCFDIRSDILNRPRTVDFSGLDTSRVGADRETLAAAYEALAEGDLLVAGVARRDATPGPAGTYGRTLHASQLYLPVRVRECVDASECTTSLYPDPVNSVEECYCPMCPVPMNATDARINAEGWRTHCEGLLDCLPPPCAPPPEVGCFDNRCEYAFD